MAGLVRRGFLAGRKMVHPKLNLLMSRRSMCGDSLADAIGKTFLATLSLAVIISGASVYKFMKNEDPQYTKWKLEQQEKLRGGHAAPENAK